VAAAACGPPPAVARLRRTASMPAPPPSRGVHAAAFHPLPGTVQRHFPRGSRVSRRPLPPLARADRLRRPPRPKGLIAAPLEPLLAFL